jgi:hypothetical protein
MDNKISTAPFLTTGSFNKHIYKNAITMIFAAKNISKSNIKNELSNNKAFAYKGNNWNYIHIDYYIPGCLNIIIDDQKIMKKNSQLNKKEVFIDYNSFYNSLYPPAIETLEEQQGLKESKNKDSPDQFDENAQKIYDELLSLINLRFDLNININFVNYNKNILPVIMKEINCIFFLKSYDCSYSDKLILDFNETPYFSNPFINTHLLTMSGFNYIVIIYNKFKNTCLFF